MKIHRGYALAGTAWLVLVVVGAVLVWAVISRAGEGVIGQSGPPIEDAAPITSPLEPESTDKPRQSKPKPKQPTRSAAPSPGSPSASAPSEPRSPSGTTTPGPEPAKPTPGGPGPGPSSPTKNPPPASSPKPPPPSSPPAEQQGVRRSWQGSEGVVTVECRGSRIELRGAQPNSGWSIEIDERGPEEVQVEFERNDGERGTRVESVCVGGSPRFEVDRED